MNLQLKRPFVFLDIESTGLHVSQDRMVEIALMKISPVGKQENKSWRMNPQKAIPEDIAKMIGITDADVADKPLFKEVGKEILHFMQGCDLAGYNPFKLDLPLLMEECLRAELEFDLSKRRIIDVQKIFFTMERRDLAAAYQFYCGKEMINHHTAQADTLATHDVFLAQLERYNELGDNLDSVSKAIGRPEENIIDLVGRIILNDKGEEIFNFGKYRSQKVTDVLQKDPAYYKWMMNGDFTAYTKKKLTEIKLQMRK